MRVPRRHRFRTDASPAVLYRALAPGPRFRFASSTKGPTWFGADPRAVVRVDADEAAAEPTTAGTSGAGASGAEVAARALRLDRLRAALPRVPVPREGGRGFPGGLVGWVTWERGVRAEGLRPPAFEPDRPELWFGVFDTFAAWDAERSEIEVVSWGLTADGEFDPKLALRRAGSLEDRLRAAAAGSRSSETTPPRPAPAPRLSLDRTGHAAAVETILEAIRAGDVYQADLTLRFEVETPEEPATLFERLLAQNPAPRSALVETEAGAVVSSSPELLLAAHGRAVSTHPIKGTIGRAPDPAADRAHAASLLASPKDRAELLMITDLLRNDLGKVCAYGSVRTPRLREVESFPHVHHLVSSVVGRLAPGADVFDALAATFPGGSIAGAPKRRAIELLGTLEPSPRGVYTGTVGWIGFDRTADLSVAIRTGFLAEGRLAFGAGGGIVADSSPGDEWAELHLKARAFLRALGAPEEPSRATAPIGASPPLEEIEPGEES